jgi:formylglycine-generating enzyme required for sulfatase activity
LGFWTIQISADRKDIRLVPKRSSELHLNVVKLLEGGACDHCLVLKNVYVTSLDRLSVDIALKHPFSDMDKYTGFDVRGIVITGSDYTFPESGRKISWTGEHIRVLSPDGYTTLFNPTEYPETGPGPPSLHYITGHYAPGGDLSATLNPFMCYNPEAERRVFGAGSWSTRTIYLQLVPGPLEFGYAVDACWEPVEGPISDPLTDFPLSANCREAYVMFAHQGAGLKPISGTSAALQVEILDHQGIDTISAVTIEAPDIFAGTQTLVVSTTTAEGVFYTGAIRNALGAQAGTYPLLIRVVDRDEDENLGRIDAWQVHTIKITDTGYPLNELIHIPAGWFYMGCDPANDPTNFWSEVPGHMHPTDAYYIGKYEVTYEEFGSFVADGGYTNSQWWSPEGWEWKNIHNIVAPQFWSHYLIGTVGPQWPVVVGYYEMEAFCNWAGGRLPSEPEWERAARGDTDHRVYPWGDQWDPTKVVCVLNPKFKDYYEWSVPVGTCSPEGDSPWGLADCLGNAQELTSDWVDLYIYEQYAAGNFNPPPPPKPADPPALWGKMARGGFINTDQNHYELRCASRQPYDDIREVWLLGFRIAYDAK